MRFLEIFYDISVSCCDLVLFFYFYCRREVEYLFSSMSRSRRRDRFLPTTSLGGVAFSALPRPSPFASSGRKYGATTARIAAYAQFDTATETRVDT